MPFLFDRDAAILERTPRTIRALLEGLGSEWTHANYGEATWSPRDIVGHYIHCDESNWLPRARVCLENSAAPFPPFDRNGHVEPYGNRSLPDLLDRFDDVRAASLKELAAMPLDAAALASTATHPAFGQVTLDQLLCTWLTHDLHHIGHICKALAFQRRPDVGPWTAYLSILDPPNPR